MVAGRTGSSSTWPDISRPYTIALLTATIQTDEDEDDDSKTKMDGKTSKGDSNPETPVHKFEWGWLPGFDGHDQPLHALANGFGDHEGTVFIAGDNFVAAWRYEERTETIKATSSSSFSSTVTKAVNVPVTINLSGSDVQGAVMAVAQLEMQIKEDDEGKWAVGYTIAIYLIAFGALLGMFLALMCNKPINQTLLNFLFEKDAHMNGISLDTLTYSAMKNTSVNDAYYRAMKTRCVSDPHLLQLIDPQEIILHRIIGEGTFGRVWSARLNSASVAVKEFVFAQAAVAGRSAQQNEIIEEIIGEAGMMAILRHPNVLQLFGCSLTAQAIWIVSELCSLGSLRHLLDDKERELPIDTRLKIALQVAEGMVYLHNQDPPIIHRDLKSHNILVHETFTEKSDGEWTIKASEVKQKVGSSGSSMKEKFPHRIDHSDRSQKMSSEATIIAKIGDWGSARATLSGTRTMTHGVGTACWLAPEVIKHARSSQHSDVYSYGIILWELATRDEVYRDLEGTQIIARVANDGLRPPVPEESPFAELMVNCWCENPTDRLSFKQIVKELNKILSDLSELKTSQIAETDSFSNAASSYQHQGPSDNNDTQHI
jgi:serine/threonine protein kinase